MPLTVYLCVSELGSAIGSLHSQLNQHTSSVSYLMCAMCVCVQVLIEPYKAQEALHFSVTVLSLKMHTHMFMLQIHANMCMQVLIEPYKAQEALHFSVTVLEGPGVFFFPLLSFCLSVCLLFFLDSYLRATS